MKQSLSRHVPILLLLVGAIAIRSLYARLTPSITINADSIGYYSLGKSFLTSPSLETFVNPYRTPLYPIFVATLIPGPETFPTSPYTQQVNQGFDLLMYVQSMLGVISVLVMYALLLHAGTGKILAFMGGLLTATNPQLFLWERTMMTEGISISLFIILLYTMVRALKNPSLCWIVSFYVLGLLGFLLRPANLIVPVIISPFIIRAVWQTQWKRLVTIVLFCLYISVPIAFRTVNTTFHGYPGISQVSDIDVFGRILEFGIPVEAATSVPFFYHVVNATRKTSAETHPFRVLDSFDPRIYTNRVRMRELGVFNRLVVSSHPLLYLQQAFLYIPRLIGDYEQLPEAPNNAAYRIFRFINDVYGVSKKLFWIVLLLFPFAGIRWMQTRDSRFEILFLLGGSIVLQLVMTVMIVYYEAYGRLTAMLTPAAYISIILWMSTLKERMRSKR